VDHKDTNEHSAWTYYAIKNISKAVALSTAFICATIMGSGSLFGWTLFVAVLLFD
jgi:energy-converting hydrogenase Eha subunit H